MKLAFALGILACASAWAQNPQPAPPAPPAPPASPFSNAGTLRQLFTSGAQTTYLGIGVQEVNAERAKALNMKEERGAEVTSVTENSPAAKAGIKEHDVVLEYNGQAVQGIEQLTRLVHETPADRQVKIVVWRNGKNETITATIETQKSEASAYSYGAPNNYTFTMPTMPQIDIPRMVMNTRTALLGIEGEPVGQEAQFAEFLGVKEGVLVKSVVKDSAAEKAGIKAGDVVVKVGDTSVKAPADITSKLHSMTNSTVTVTVVRNKKEMPITVTIENAVRTRGAARPARTIRTIRAVRV